MENININTFNDWALKGKDEGMERGHAPAVNKMLDIIYSKTSSINKKFNFLDIGCGNGWVVRKFTNHKNCNVSLGIDGAPAMIDKAKSKDDKGNYININIEEWKCNESFDIIFSMETFYYLENIDTFINNLYDNGINDNGSLIIGIDHYKENTSTLTWEKDYNLKTTTLSIEDWHKKLSKYSFSNIRIYQYGQKEDWEGTLILHAQK